MKIFTIAFFLSIFSMQTMADDSRQQSMASGSRLVVDATQPPDFKCEAIIEKERAKFLFRDEAILHKDGLLLNDNSSSAIEFAWLVYFDEKYVRGDVVYQGFDFGVRYYTKNEEPKQTTLEELFKLSGVHGFAYGSKYFLPIYFEKDSLAVKVIGNDVVLSLTRSPTTSFFFENPPKYANFWVIVNKRPSRKCMVSTKQKN